LPSAQALPSASFQTTLASKTANTAISMLFAKSWSNYKYTMDTNSSSISATQGLNSIIDTIRKARSADNGAYPIKSVADFDLVIFSDKNGDGVTERLHYYIDGENLMVGISEPSGAPPVYSSGDDTSEIVVKNVINDATHPIFYYYDNVNNVISSPASNLPDIRMIKVNLIIEGNSASDVNMESFASLRNLSENDTIQ